jgi:deoxyribonuclease-1
VLKLTLLWIFAFFNFCSTAYGLDFYSVKKKLKKIYQAQPQTFYCGCDITWLNDKKLIPTSLTDCGVHPRKNTMRMLRIEWEHVVPAYWFGHQRQCWQRGGRKNCRKSDREFREMEGDIFNLQPALGEINGDRNNYRYGLIPGEIRLYGQCDAEVDFRMKIFEPRVSIRGDIARIYFYFEHRYSFKMSPQQKNIMVAWDKLDPVDENECKITRLKARVQGWTNPFVERLCNL